jgi:hypothetical protein
MLSVVIGWSPTNPAFDAIFYTMQLAVLCLWLLAVLTVRLQRRFARRRWVALGVAAGFGLVLPAAWNLRFPAASGLDGAGRMILGGAFTTVNGLLSSLWAAASAADAVSPRWPAVWPFLAIAAASLVGWLIFA